MSILNQRLSLLLTTVLLIAIQTACTNRSAKTLARLEALKVLPPPETISIEITGYCPQRGAYRELFVSNYSNSIVRGEFLTDSDKDGVPDSVEDQANASTALALNISPTLSDSNGDLFSDLFIYLTGINRTEERQLRCQDPGIGDGTGLSYIDPTLPTGSAPQFLGLRNCEKSFLKLGSAAGVFDSDNDSIPDYLELRCGLNPKDPKDALLDADTDGISNIEECKRHTPFDESNTVFGVQKYEYQYDVERDPGLQAGCSRFRISNIPIVNSGENNLIALFLLESGPNQESYLEVASLPLTAGSANIIFELPFRPGFIQQ